MTRLLRPLIALSALLAISANSVPQAYALGNATTDRWVDPYARFDRVGFLDLKTFLVVPMDKEGDLGTASDAMRVISPETLFSHLPRTNLIKSMKPEDLAGTVGPSGIDSMTVNVNGQPLTLSTGLSDAMKKDLDRSLETWGATGLFQETSGFATAAWLGAATRDVLALVDRLESYAETEAAPKPAPSGDRKVGAARAAHITSEPTTLSLFLLGLLVIVWLHRDRLAATQRR